MKKHYVLDTSVLIEHPLSVYAFNDSVVILPDIVLNELESCKITDNSTRAANAQKAITVINYIAQKGNFSEGILLDNNVTIKIIFTDDYEPDLPKAWSANNPVSKILASAKELQKKYSNTVLVSENVLLRTKSNILGICALSYDEYIDSGPIVHSGHESLQRHTQCL